MITDSFKRALWVYHLNCGSCNGCDIEVIAALTPRYDVERFGIRLVGTPRHADVIVACGPVNYETKDIVQRIYDQVPEPKAVLLVGNCASTTGVFYNSYHIVGTMDEIIPEGIYIYVPGCPPRPEAIIWGVVEAWKHIEKLQK